MNLASKKTIKEILKKYNIRPSKKFGQNFLIDKSVIGKVIKSANLKPFDTILEIGPGIGTLTIELSKQVKKVIACEKDPKMCEILNETLENLNNVKIIQGDILKIKSQIPKSYKIVANLPFYLTAPVIRKFLEPGDVKPRQMILIVQKEVAQRLYAKPPKMSILAVSVQFYAQVKIIDYISKKSFWPEPKVDAAIIKIIPRSSTYYSAGFCERFFRIVKAGFSHPRKQILNNLSDGLKLNREKIKKWLSQNKIQPSQRAEILTIKDWLNLTKTLDPHTKRA
ncbi:ribosomal RNA small subunit methyltransferase A [Candidatus Parcubacteria bacterium]|nr:ribosomal RNA small subunit methyltransferase A [Candidatus Parcubacteria bacterium]